MDEINSTSEIKKSSFSFNPKDNPVAFIAFLFFAFLAFGAISIFMLNLQNRSNGENTGDGKVNFNPISNHTVVYGFWTGGETKVQAADLSTGEIFSLASIAANVKKVSLISSDSIIFMNKTDVRDHAQEIATYNLSTKQISSIIQASSGFGIDDYVISASKRYIALWEVVIPQDKALDSGQSRVYTVDLQNPQVKNLIYDENILETTFAHYPVAVTDSGDVFMDTFKPNAGAGWANGMSYASFDGSIKSSIEQMQSGTYGTQPKMSPDGRMLAFGGFNGTAEAGREETNGFKKAIVSPNTIETFDLYTKTRTKLPNISDENIYPSVFWDSRENTILYSLMSKNKDIAGEYSYVLASASNSKINSTLGNDFSVLTGLGSNKYLVGVFNNESSALGNLGDTYSQMVSQLGILVNGKNTNLNTDQSLVQYIDTFPGKYFSGINTIDAFVSTDDTQNQLQLQTFTLKPSLEPKRLEQQSNPAPQMSCEGSDGDCPVEPTPKPDEPTPTPIPPRPLCIDLRREWCNQQLGTNYQRGDNYAEGEAFQICWEESKKHVVGCADSPLYLYGDKGKNVSVYIATPVSSSNAPYNGEYSGILTGSGGIVIGGVEYSSLDYDYVPAIKKIPRLTYGRVVKSSEVGKVVEEFSKKLGLNKTETLDTVNDLNGKINSGYVFVSFFDEKTSRAILPISFNPKPDVYRNIVFFLKSVEAPYSVNEPKFEAYPTRKGFTAVEVSYIVEN